MTEAGRPDPVGSRLPGNGPQRSFLTGRPIASFPASLLAFFAFLFVGLTTFAAPAAANDKYAAIVMDEASGEVLFSRRADHERFPASLTKVMTLYLLFEKITAGDLTLESKLKVSKRAAGQPPSKIGVKVGGTITVDDAISALVVRSANDVAVVVAEEIAGTERKFARLMTDKAEELGMTRTRFRNASGLPNRSQVTTARDMARLGIAIRRDYPQFAPRFQQERFKWGKRTWTTHNHVLRNYRWADGMKTGYTRASGFNLMTSAERHGVGVMAVVMGGRTAKRRDKEMVRILNLNFKRIASNPKYKQRRLAALPRPVQKPGSRPEDDIDSDLSYPAVLAAAAPRPTPAPDTAVAPADIPVPEPRPGDATEDDSDAPAAPTIDDVIRVAEAKPIPPMPDLNAMAAGVGMAPRSQATDGSAEGEAGGEASEAGEKGEDPIAREIARAQDVEVPFSVATTPEAVPTDPVARVAPDGSTVLALNEPAPGAIDEPGDPDADFGQGDGLPRVAMAIPGAGASNVGIQVGAFLRMTTATRFIEDAMILAPEVLNRNAAAIIADNGSGTQVFRARFGPMTEEDANTACGLLEARGMECFAFKEEDWSNAVRMP